MFEPFFTTRAQAEAAGLGLSISLGIIKELGRTIKVKSKIGEGAVFTIELPVAEDKNKG